MNSQMVSPNFDYRFTIAQNERRLFILANIIFILSLVIAIITGSAWVAILTLTLVALPILCSNSVLSWYLAFSFVIISQEVVVPGLRAAIQIPTEPLIFLILFLWISTLVLEGRTKLLLDYLDLPFFALFGMLIFSIVISTYPLVTFKSVLNTMWYVGIGYFFFKSHFRRTLEIKRVVALFLTLATMVAAIVIIRHSFYGFVSSVSGSLVVIPFFPEHGSYSAYLSFAFAIALSLTPVWSKLSIPFRILICLCLPVTLMGIIFSYTRGAWLGVGVLFLFFFVAKLRELLSLRGFLILGIIIILIVGSVTISGVGKGLERNFNSIFRAEANVSNLERFNRWWVAIDIFRNYPLTGSGYGTYGENYFRHRAVFLRTPISGRMMRAHNEYLTVLAELGLLGVLVSSWLFFRILKRGIRVFILGKDAITRHLALGALGGILTYLVHGFFNSFLEFDKVAFPFWILVGLLAVLEIGQQSPQQKLVSFLKE